ncbi:MAG: hypothetical protein R6U63_01600 [Longimicrobiales bacterium]
MTPVTVDHPLDGVDEAPDLLGQHFHEFLPPFADFALHAWVWKGNPNGVFANFNPTVSCPTDQAPRGCPASRRGSGGACFPARPHLAPARSPP